MYTGMKGGMAWMPAFTFMMISNWSYQRHQDRLIQEETICPVTPGIQTNPKSVCLPQLTQDKEEGGLKETVSVFKVTWFGQFSRKFNYFYLSSSIKSGNLFHLKRKHDLGQYCLLQTATESRAIVVNMPSFPSQHAQLTPAFSKPTFDVAVYFRREVNELQLA